MMKIAGMSGSEVQDSMVASMATSGSVLTTSLSENLKHVRELRYAFGETTTAIAHLGEVSKSNAILNAINGGGKDQVWELVKSLEGKGVTYDPQEFSSYVDVMTQVVQATGGRVTPQMFMSTMKYGRTATLGWDEAFIGGALPRLIQSMATTGSGGGSGNGGPGNALMSAFAKIVQGQMPKTAAEEFERLGLGSARHITGSAESQMVGGINGRSLFQANPYEWVQQVLMPALTAKGITSQDQIIEEISRLFPVRTASQVVAEMALQGRAHEGANSPFEKDIRLQHGAMGLPAYDELIKNDYPTIVRAFNQQWKNLLETLGSPMMAPGGPVISALAGLASAMGGIAQFAGRNSDTIRAVVEAVGHLANIFYTIDKIALTGIAKLSGISGIFGTLASLPWETISSGLSAVSAGLEKIGRFFGMGAASAKPSDPNFDDRWNALKHNSMFSPGSHAQKAQPISLSLNVDGRTLAQAISEQIESLYRYDTNAPAFNGAGTYGA